MNVEYNRMNGLFDILKWIVAPVTSLIAETTIETDESKEEQKYKSIIDQSTRELMDTPLSPGGDTEIHAPLTTAPTIPDNTVITKPVTEVPDIELPEIVPPVLPGEQYYGMTLEQYLKYLRELGELIARRRELEREKEGQGFDFKNITEYLPFVGIGTGIFKAIWGTK